jgi:hypothetical protein
VRRLAAAFVVLGLTNALADPPSEDVVMAGGDGALLAALVDVLAPAQVIAVDDSPPISIGDLTVASKRVVQRENTRAALWLVADDAGATLVAYDRFADRVLVRSLAYPAPLSAANAASAARSARAMLRTLRLDGEVRSREERWPRAPPGATESPVPAREALRSAPERFGTMAGLAVRIAAPGNDAAGELSFGAMWRRSALGLTVDFALAPAATLRTSMFEGSIADRSAAVTARYAASVSPRVRIGAFGGLALHAIHFRGDTPERQIADWRFDPALRFGGLASYALYDGVDLAIAVSVDSLLRRQRYEVEGQEVVTMARLQGATGLTLVFWLL